jgi:RNA-directed DNA polymerase
VKTIEKEERPLEVGESPKQDGEDQILGKWRWTEPSVWTERMLTTLEKGVKGGKWFSLVDKVYSSENLRASWEKVRGNGGAAGVDRQSIGAYGKEAEKNLVELEKALRGGTYKSKPVKRVWIPKPGSKEKRPLGVPVVTDRIVQTAMRNVLEPIFEVAFAEQSYGFRPGRGCKDALRRVEELLKSGNRWVVDADIKSYFDSISHDKLMKEVEEQIADGRILEMIEGYLKHGIMDGLKEWEAEKGTPQGAVISPLLANIYLSKIDHEMAKLGYEMVRYADDSVILCRGEGEARRALEEMKRMLEVKGLALHPDKTKIVDATQEGGFDFLGYHFERGMRYPRKKSMDKMKTTIRHKTRRTSGESMECIVGELNASLRGWYVYFKHSHIKKISRIDGWIRMRLRSILRKRHGGKGRSRGADHQRWTNAYFANLGLFTITAAHALDCQSRRGNY